MKSEDKVTLIAMIAEVVGLAVDAGRAVAENDADARAREAEVDRRCETIGAFIDAPSATQRRMGRAPRAGMAFNPGGSRLPARPVTEAGDSITGSAGAQSACSAQSPTWPNRRAHRTRPGRSRSNRPQ